MVPARASFHRRGRRRPAQEERGRQPYQSQRATDWHGQRLERREPKGLHEPKEVNERVDCDYQ